MAALEGKVAVVTGSGRGIGRAIALAMAEEGASVVVNGHKNAESVNETAAEISKMGCKCLPLMSDVSNPDEVERLVVKSLEVMGHIDILVNNAGVFHPAVSLFDLDLSHLDLVFNTNFKGMYLCSLKFGAHMRERKDGCIINISSLAGITPLPLMVYGPMKSAVNMFTRIMACEMAQHKVRVNAVAPGYVMTSLVKDMIEKGERDASALLDRVPMHEFIMPEDIAHTVVFLAGEKAHFINGEIVVVDGGWRSDGGWSAYPTIKA